MEDDSREELLKRIENLREGNKVYIDLLEDNFKLVCKLENDLDKAKAVNDAMMQLIKGIR
jgi:hypothetical protein